MTAPKTLKRLYALVARGLNGSTEDECRTSAVLALRLMEREGLLDDILALRFFYETPPKPRVRPRPTADDKSREKGGYTRAVKLTPEERSKIASKAAKTRWDKRYKKLTKKAS